MPPLTVENHLINPHMLKLARDTFQSAYPGLRKAAFVPGGDPSMGGGAPPPGGDPSGGMPPGGDPSGGGGAPPPDPSMMGGDPSGGGGAPPPPPPPSGGSDPAMLAKMDQMISMMGAGGGGGSGQNAAGQIKPKIDVNVAIMQMSKMIARIADALGVKIPASEMIATPDDLTGMANKQMAGGQEDATMAPGGAGGAPGGIPPMQGMSDMSAGPGKTAADKPKWNNGNAYDYAGLADTSSTASAILRFRNRAG